MVSVVVAVKNGARNLQRCLDSIAEQTGIHAETIVIDGGSLDGTPAILERNSARLSYWCSEPDTGIYAAWNKALRRSKGVWICFLGSDDVFHDIHALRDLLAAAQASAGRFRVVYGRINLVTARGAVAQTVGKPWAASQQEFLDGFMIPHPGMLHHRLLFEAHGYFDESYRIAGDYEMLLREFRKREPLFVNRVIVDMQLGGASVRPRTIHKALREVTRARTQHGLHAAPPRLRRALAASRLGAWLHRLLGDRAFSWIADAYRLARGRPRVWTV